MAKRGPRSGGVESGRSATPATVALTAAAIAFTVHSYDHDPAADSYGDEMAEATGAPRERVFKTLVADVDGRLVVGVVPITDQLDLKALAAAVGGKRGVMADPQLAERTTGYVRGGISPIGQRKTLPIVLDDSALAQPTIFVSGGRRGLSVELVPADLVTLVGARVAPIRRA